jgi:ankyrin repeat protein
VFSRHSLNWQSFIALFTLAFGSAAVQADSRLAEAARAADAGTVRSLLKQRADVDGREGDGSTALLWATYRMDLDMVKALLAAKADPDLANRYGVTPLLQASRVGNAAIVEALLKAGADPAKAVRGGETPLMAAAGAGNLDAVKRLLDRKIDVNAKEPEQGQTALMWASAEGHLPVVKALIAAGADVNVQARPVELDNEALPDQGRQWSDYSRGGLTALMVAAREGHLDVATALVEAGARLDAKTPDNLTALLLAVINDSLDVAAMLLDHGSNPNDGALYELVQLRNLKTTSTAADATRPRPDLHNAIDTLQLARRFLDKGADPNHPTNHVIHADGKGGVGSNSNIGIEPQNTYRTVLLNKDVDMLRLFIGQKKVDPNLLPPGAVTPLYVAASPAPFVFGDAPGPLRYPGERGAPAAVEVLLAAGADVNGLTDVGDTALHRAAQSGDLATLKVLAGKGAKFDVQNKAGLTALDIAMGKRPPPAPGARPGGGPGRDGPQPDAVVLLRQMMGLPPLPADQLPKRAAPPVF